MAAGSWQWQKPLKLLVGVDACNPRSQRRKLSAAKDSSFRRLPPKPPPFFRPYPCCVAPFLCVANSNKATLETEYTEKMGRKNHWLVAILTEGTLFEKSIAPLSFDCKIFSKLEFIENLRFFDMLHIFVQCILESECGRKATLPTMCCQLPGRMSPKQSDK